MSNSLIPITSYVPSPAEIKLGHKSLTYVNHLVNKESRTSREMLVLQRFLESNSIRLGDKHKHENRLYNDARRIVESNLTTVTSELAKRLGDMGFGGGMLSILGPNGATRIQFGSRPKPRRPIGVLSFCRTDQSGKVETVSVPLHGSPDQPDLREAIQTAILSIEPSSEKTPATPTSLELTGIARRNDSGRFVWSSSLLGEIVSRFENQPLGDQFSSGSAWDRAFDKYRKRRDEDTQ